MGVKKYRCVKKLALMSWRVYGTTMNEFEPWSTYPSLTPDRLSIVGGILRRVRNETVALHESEAGDSPWSLGCRIYSRTCFALREASAKYGWLTIVDEAEPLCFTFAIGSVPFKFYRGSPDDPPGRLLEMTYGELRQQQLVFDIEGIRLLDKILRIAVETFSNGEAATISVVEMDKAGVVTGTYSIRAVIELSNVTPLQAKPIDLPAPTLEPIENSKEKEKDNGELGAIPSVLG
jgi:hypothetical protein